jgi:uncharacterized protein (DUF1810 family)
MRPLAAQRKKLAAKGGACCQNWLERARRFSADARRTGMDYNVERFKTAQKYGYDDALKEMKSGRKSGHWIWYIFPQHVLLGQSSTAKFYGLRGLEEAEAYLDDPLLRERLIEISNVLLEIESNDPGYVFGYPDDLKVRSCMTIFSKANNTDPVFQAVLDKFYNGKPDRATIGLLENRTKKL